MVWGEAGIGKTTFASKLVQDWSEVIKGRQSEGTDKVTEEQCHLLSKIGLILLIVSREIKENQSLDDIVQDQIFDAVCENSETKYRHSVKVSDPKYQKDILLVLDGLDEIPDEESQVVDAIIAGNKYTKLRCIVMCRPHVALGTCMSLASDAEIRLKGFSKSQAQHFVYIFFRMQNPDDMQIANEKSKKCWNHIESSPDLLEMAINPSMLQLLCKLYSVNGKIAKDKADIFKDYTNYLLQQYHFKIHKKTLSESDLNRVYNEALLNSGKLALQGLKQSHLQLVFSKDTAESLAGKEVFDIGFVTEIPCYRHEKPKVQFQHKTHQEYLAAYFIVNSPSKVGMRYLMEFCSTSKGLMGSQIILTFITTMSTNMGKVVQAQIRELVSSWASEDDVSPKDRTSFLLTMLKENRSLVFPLPKEIDIDMRESEANVSVFERVLHKFGRQSILEKFFSFDNGGVEKISMVIGKENGLELTKNMKLVRKSETSATETSLQEFIVDFQGRDCRDAAVHLKNLTGNNKKLKILSLIKLSPPCVQDIFTDKPFITALKDSKQLKVIKIYKCEGDIGASVTDALKNIPEHVQLDISGNRFENQSVCRALIKRAEHLESLQIQDCGIVIDTEIAEAISQLPEHVNLDMSGNRVAKMDSSLLCHVIPVVNNKKIDLSGLGMDIDDKVAEALSGVETKVEIDLSGNQVTGKSACIKLLNKSCTQQAFNIFDCIRKCGIQIDAEIAEAVSRLPDHTELDLSGNRVLDKSVCIALLQKAASIKGISLCNCGIQIDTEIAETISKLPGEANLDLSGNKLSNISCNLLCHVIPVLRKKKVDLSGLGIVIDSRVAKAFSCMHKDMEIDLSGNKIADRSACLALLHNAATNKSINVNDCLCKCDIQIDAEIAEAVSRLPDNTELDLSGNKVTDKSVCITLIKRAATMKSLNLTQCNIQIDQDVAEALTKLPDNTVLDLSNNKVTDQSACITLIVKTASLQWLNIHNCLRDCNIQINTEVVEAISRLPNGTRLNLSGNQLVDKSCCITLIQKAATMKYLSIAYCGMQIDTEIAEVISKLPDYAELDLSGNHVTDKSSSIALIHKAATMKSLGLANCGIQIDPEISELVYKLPCDTELDLNGNSVTDKTACITLIHKAATMKYLNMCDCGIQIDTEIAEAISELPENANLDLSGNTITQIEPSLLCHVIPVVSHKKIDLSGLGVQIDHKVAEAVGFIEEKVDVDLSGSQITDEEVCITLIPTAASLKQLNLSDCGISIDNEIAEAISKLPEQANLDLSGNTVTKMDSRLLCHVIPVVSNKKIDLSGLGVVIDNEVATAIQSLDNDVEMDLSGNKVAGRNACITLMVKATTMKSLNIRDCLSNCGIQIDAEVAKTVSKLPDETDLDLSGNQVSDKSACITLIQKAGNMKSLNIANCGIQIDTDIAKEISQLPEQANLDLSGNTVTKMDSSLLCHVIPVVRNKKIDLSELGVVIDTKLANSLEALDRGVEIDFAGNKVSGKSACITLMHMAATVKSLGLAKCEIQIDTDIAEAVSMLPDHAQLDLSGNQVTDKSVYIILIQKAVTMESLIICNFGLKIDAEIAEAVSRLPDNTELDLSGNQVTDKSACMKLINKAATMKSLDIHDCICNCGLQIDSEIAEAVSTLPGEASLNLSGNQAKDESACLTLLQKAATMKSLNICNCMCNRGIQIDSQIAEAVSRLPDNTELDLSGNQISDQAVCITLINKSGNMKSLAICDCDIQIDAQIAEAVSKLPENTQLDMSGNDISRMAPNLLSKLLLYTTKERSIDIRKGRITIDENLIKAFSYLTQLKRLRINFADGLNKVTSTAAAELPTTLSCLPKLQEFFLGECGISDDVMVALTASLYKHCPLLEELSISDNHLSSGVWEVLEHIEQMKNLKYLWLGGNPCVRDGDQRNSIRAALHKSNPRLTVYLTK